MWVQHTYLKLLYQVEPYVTVPTARAIGMENFEISTPGSQNQCSASELHSVGIPNGIRTRVSTLKVLRPKPLVDRNLF